MSENPYTHLTVEQLNRSLRQVERNLMKIARGKGKNMDFNVNRTILLSIADALNHKEEIAFLNNISVSEE